MESAYDFKYLVELLKGQGMDIAEDAAILVVEQVFIWLEESAKLSENSYDDLALVLYPVIKAKVMEYADKIDGEVG